MSSGNDYDPTIEVELTSNYGPVVWRALLDESDDGTEVVLDDDINGAVDQLKYRDVNETVELKTQASGKENTSVFDRLLRRSTVSSELKSSPRKDKMRAKQPLKFKSPYELKSNPRKDKMRVKQPQKFKSSVNSEFLNRLRRPTEASLRQPAGGNQSTPLRSNIKHEKPPNNPSPWKLTCTMKDKGKLTQKPITLNITQHLKSIEQGLVDEQSSAQILITALFDRDFTPGERSTKWEIESSTVSREAVGNSMKFVSEKKARFDWKGVYSIASATGTICFYPDQREIFVEDYHFCVACRRFSFYPG